MPVAYAAAVKTARMTATRDQVANGVLQIGTAGMAVVLAEFGLSASGGTISGDVWTLAFDSTDVSAVGSGAPAAARILDSQAAPRITGLTAGLTGSGADIELDASQITAGQQVTLTSATFTHAP
jgi:hypothetical protein